MKQGNLAKGQNGGAASLASGLCLGKYEVLAFIVSGWQTPRVDVARGDCVRRWSIMPATKARIMDINGMIYGEHGDGAGYLVAHNYGLLWRLVLCRELECSLKWVAEHGYAGTQ